MRRLLVLALFSSMLGAQAPPELVVSVGHSASPGLAVFAGRYLATASSSNVAIVDLASGLTVRHLPQGSRVMAMEANPAGDLLAVETCDRAINLWDVTSHRLVRRLALTQECAQSLSFSPDGAYLATGAEGCCSEPSGLQVWDVRSGTLTRELAKGTRIRHVVFGGDGRWLAGVAANGDAILFEWPSGRRLRTLTGLTDGPSSTALASHDGRYFAWSGGGLRVWDVRSGREIPLPGATRVTITDGPPEARRQWSELQVTAYAPEFLNDGRLAYSDGLELIVMQLPDGPRQVIPVAAWDARWLRIRRDGLMLAGVGDAGETMLWDVAATKRRELIAPPLVDTGPLHWSRFDVLAWATGFDLHAWDGRQGRRADLGRDPGWASAFRPSGLAFSRSGARIAVTGSSSAYLFDLAGRRTIALRDLPPDTDTAVAISPDGARLAFASSPDSFDLFDDGLRWQRRIASLEKHTVVERVAFSPDNRWIAAGLGPYYPALRVWPVSGSGRAVTLDASDTPFGEQPPAFSSDSQWLASFTKGTSLTIWSTASWTVARTWTLPGSGQALAFAPEGSRLAVASIGEAAIWDAGSGRKLTTFPTPGSTEMAAIAWSPNGRRVAALADDGVLRVWNAADGSLLASIYLLESSAGWLLVTPDGRVDGSDDALARLVAWRVGGRVTTDSALTRRHRVPGLWRSLVASGR